MVRSSRFEHISRRLVNVVLVVAFIFGSYLLVSSAWKYYEHQQLLKGFQEEVAAANREDATPEERQAAEGKDEAEAKDPLAGYRVAADQPRAIYIDKLGVKAKVLPMGLNPDRSIQAPINIFDTGWYTGSSKPGEAGASLISGHASGPFREGLFAYVDTLASGDKVEIELGDGSRLTYEVVKKQEIPLEQTDMAKILTPIDDGEWLNLITCSGEWLKDGSTFNKRLTVYTKRVA